MILCAIINVFCVVVVFSGFAGCAYIVWFDMILLV